MSCRCRRRRPCSTRRFATSFLFSTRLDVSSSSSFVVVVFVVVVVTKNTPYRGVTARWACPLTALLPCTFTVLVSSTLSLSTHIKTSIPWCDRPFGPSPNGGSPRLASLPCRTLRHGSRLKTCIVDVQRFVLSSYLVCFTCRRRRRCRPVRLDVLSTPFLLLTDSTRLVVVVFVVIVCCCSRRALQPVR